MPLYTGKSADGSDMTEVEGFFINPDNPDEFSSNPYPAQRRLMNIQRRLSNYMSDKYSLNDVYNQIKEHNCPIPAIVKQYVLSHYDNEGNFIEQKQHNNGNENS